MKLFSLFIVANE